MFPADLAVRLAPLPLYPVKKEEGWIWVALPEEGPLTQTQHQIEEHRKRDALILVRDKSGCPQAGLSVRVEQAAHEFLFGCVVPDLGQLSGADRRRYRARLNELFNHIIPPDQPPSVEVVHVDVPDYIHLGVLHQQLDRLACAGRPLDVFVRGQTVGMAERSERDSARRVAELYTLCFAHPSVRGIFWNGFWDDENGGNGLLRNNLAPKFAYRGLQKLIASLWHTRAAGQTDAAGCFHFRGFRGTYRVIVRDDDRPATVGVYFLGRRPAGEGPFLVEVPVAE